MRSENRYRYVEVVEFRAQVTPKFYFDKYIETTSSQCRIRTAFKCLNKYYHEQYRYCHRQYILGVGFK